MYKQDVNDNGRYAKDIKKKGFQVMLPAAVKIWPTPNASDNRDRGNLSDPAIQRRIKMGKQVGLTMAVKDQKGGGTLNPMWVEWLMGYPIGWTDLNHSETA
jgi:DNA (cytosine-5)-methyltransferase 1